MAHWLVRGHRKVRPSLKRVRIWNRTIARAEELAAQLEGEGIAAEAVTDLDAATREADIITTCTRSRAPLVKGANLKPGTHLDLVGGFTPDTRESDDESSQRSRIFSALASWPVVSTRPSIISSQWAAVCVQCSRIF